jgi:hypothetical protein
MSRELFHLNAREKSGPAEAVRGDILDVDIRVFVSRGCHVWVKIGHFQEDIPSGSG